MPDSVQPPHQVSALWPVQAVLAFSLELAVLWACALLGFHLSLPPALRVLAAVASATPVGIFWALYLAPMSSRRLRGLLQPAAKAVIFTLGATLALAADKFVLALGIGALAVITLVLEYALNIRPPLPVAASLRNDAKDPLATGTTDPDDPNI